MNFNEKRENICCSPIFFFFRCNIEIYRLAQLFFVGQWARVVNNCTHQLEKKVALRRKVDLVVGS